MLSQMSRTGILVNIGRAQIVVKEDLIRFLRENPGFIYATDVWWNKQEMQRDIELLTFLKISAQGKDTSRGTGV
jgi:lactate dehydrogenase-like 2-hydroxyacid dehydrogenase